MFRDYLIQTLVLSNLLTQFQLHVHMAPLGVLVKKPMTSLQKALGKDRILPTHNNAGYHNDAVVRGNAFIHTFENPTERIDNRLDDAQADQYKKNMHTLERIIDIILLLGRQGIPLRGHWDDHLDLSAGETTVNKGNFWVLLEHQSKTDAIMRNHLLTAPKNAKYTSKTIQEIIIDISGKMIREKLTKPLRTGGVPFYAVIADEVTDRYANQEVLSVCIRYVDVTGGGSAEIVKKLIDFVELTRTTGEAVGNGILASLRTANLDLKMIRGQAYDGASSTSSAHVGAQAVVKEASNQNATYVHCHSHRLNLSIASSCKLPEIRSIIGIVNEIFLFFDFSPKRQKFLEVVLAEYAPDTRHEKLKGLCKTRWVERHTCLETFLELYKFIIACLCAMCKPDDYPAVQQQVWDWDRETQTRAQGRSSSTLWPS